MKLIITGKRVKLDEALREHIERRVYFALSRFSPRVAFVLVTVDRSENVLSLPSQEKHADKTSQSELSRVGIQPEENPNATIGTLRPID